MSVKQKRLSAAIERAQRCLQQGRAAEALETVERALSRAPSHPVLLKLGAVAAFQSGNTAQAVSMLETAIESYPDDSEAHFNLGVVHQSAGQLEAALVCFRHASELSPGSPEAHYNVATAQYELGHPEEAVAAYHHAIEANAGYVPAHAGLAYTLRGLGRLSEALTAYEKAVQFAPEDAQTMSGYGITLQHLDRLDEAERVLRQAVSLDPGYPDATTNLADVLVQRGQADAAVLACDRYLAGHPGDSGVLASKAIALHETGATANYASLVDFDRFLLSQHPEAPGGFAGNAAFNDALAAHMLAHPTLVEAPASHATRGGKHTGELLGDRTAPMAAFQAMINHAVSQYITRLGDDASHPFIATAPDRWRMTAWSIVLQGQGGYQAPHIHPSAWVSGVYYARVPDVVRDADAEQAGWIEFGLPSSEFHWTRTPETRSIQPEPGLLVLFPSYFFHRTIPYDATGTRISIAFDVLPVG